MKNYIVLVLHYKKYNYFTVYRFVFPPVTQKRIILLCALEFFAP